MDILINPVEARVLGCLIEKELTTPEYYPLSLHALAAACNQKSNRAPTLQLAETEVVRALDGLRDQRLAREGTSSATRVPKYSHSSKDTLGMSTPALAVLCELLVRGPQTLAELRTRAARMAVIEDIDPIITELSGRPAGALVTRLAREPGKREERYAHLLCGPIVATETKPALPLEPARLTVLAENERITTLEADVLTLRDELAQLKAQFSDFAAQFK